MMKKMDPKNRYMNKTLKVLERYQLLPLEEDLIIRGASTFNKSFLSAKSKPVGMPVFMITSDEKRWGASFTTDRPVKPPLQRISSLYVSN